MRYIQTKNRNEQEQNKSKILLDKIFRFYYNKKHDVCPHRTDILYHFYVNFNMNFKNEKDEDGNK